MKKNTPVVHFEMPAKDVKRMADFYTKAFGWNMQMMGEEMGNYAVAHTTDTDANGMIKTPGVINGGFYPTKDWEKDKPSVVISVDDLKTAMEDIKAAGGQLINEPHDIPGVGTFVSFTDTEGNRASILQPLMKR